MPPTAPAIFQASNTVYHADTCESVRDAATQGRIVLHAVGHGSYPGAALPDSLLPEVRSAGYWDAPARQDWGLDEHRNEGIELTYVARGTVAFTVDGQRTTLKQGHLTITRPWQAHRLGDPHLAANRLYWLILDVGVRRPNHAWRWPDWLVLTPEELTRLTTRLSHNEHPMWPADAEVARCFTRLGEIVAGHEPERLRTRLALAINDLLLAVLELLERQDAPLDSTLVSTQRTVEMFLAALPEKITHPWSVEEMAAQCGLERSRFAHYCHLITNASPIAYLIRCRIEVARNLLLTEPRRSITDIALSCGFSTSQHFATMFRAHCGQTPRALRQSIERRGPCW